MSGTIHEAEGWRRMTLRDRPRPLWLSEKGPDLDVVLSSRVRLARNLRGFKFSEKCAPHEIQQIAEKLILAGQATGDYESFRGLTTAERDYLVGARLLSPDFPWTLPGRALLIDRRQSIGLMIHEEDHLRAQAITPGWSIREADKAVYGVTNAISDRCPFAWSPKFGFLTASVPNCGEGSRHSAMLHLIGLATTGQMNDVIRALLATRLTIRGLFGESSRALGAFAQVSLVNGTLEAFEGAVQYLVDQERAARRAVTDQAIAVRVDQALTFLSSSRAISVSDALRAMGWIRWGTERVGGSLSIKGRDVDAALAGLDMRVSLDGDDAAIRRADYLRKRFIAH